jgi:hypothetical protein
MHHFNDFAILLAQASSGAEGGRTNSLSWAIVIFLTLLGLAISLTPAKRTYEVKKHKE